LAALAAALVAWPGTTDGAGEVAQAAAVDGAHTAHGMKPADCATCHREIHGEWAESAHARAFTHDAYQAALARRQRPELCMPCHAPASVLDRLGRMPDLRAGDREHGITCAACHSRGDTIFGPFGAATDAHPTGRDAAFGERGSIALCSGCHDRRIADVLPVAQDFEKAGFADEGMSCIGCHMQERTRAIANDPATGSATGPEREGRSHRIRGPAEAAFSARAFSFRLERNGTEAMLYVGNDAGHRVPGLARGRTYAMRFRQLDAAGRQLAESRLDIHGANPLLAREERAIPVAWQPGATRLEVRVEHRYGNAPPQQVVLRELAPEAAK
jgi:hypothetical protein